MRNLIASCKIAIAVVLFFNLAGCVKDVAKNTITYTYYEPIYKTRAEVLANMKSNPAKAINVPGKICMQGAYIYINEVNKGIHVIDNTNPATPKKIGFIDIPGNVDIAIKGNTLYADFYTDLIALDIANPRNIYVKNSLRYLFPERFYYGFVADTSKVIAGWTKQTVTRSGDINPGPIYYQTGVLYNSMDAAFSGSSFKSSASTPVGLTGSLSRFALMNDYLYSVGWDSLRITSVKVEDAPVKMASENVGWGVETVFPFKNNLLMGTQTGMLIYGMQNPLVPEKLGVFNHVRTCDPVIADGETAYVTLHSGSLCAGFTNQMDVLNIADLFNPTLIKTYPLTNPRGLGKDGNLLFVCDGKDGLKVFDATDASNIKQLATLDAGEANDVIAWHNIALVMSADGIYQFDYSNRNAIKLLSKISISAE